MQFVHGDCLHCFVKFDIVKVESCIDPSHSKIELQLKNLLNFFHLLNPHYLHTGISYIRKLWVKNTTQGNLSVTGGVLFQSVAEMATIWDLLFRFIYFSHTQWENGEIENVCKRT